MQNNTTVTSAPVAKSDSILRGMATGLAPAAFFYVAITLGFGVIALLRAATTGLGFLTQLPVLNVTSALYLLALAAGFVLVSVRAFRQARACRAAGDSVSATAALCGLGLSALLILTPVLIAVLLPQHPAYIR